MRFSCGHAIKYCVLREDLFCRLGTLLEPAISRLPSARGAARWRRESIFSQRRV
jgi:hypothetical protein